MTDEELGKYIFFIKTTFSRVANPAIITPRLSDNKSAATIRRNMKIASKNDQNRNEVAFQFITCLTKELQKGKRAVQSKPAREPLN